MGQALLTIFISWFWCYILVASLSSLLSKLPRLLFWLPPLCSTANVLWPCTPLHALVSVYTSFLRGLIQSSTQVQFTHKGQCNAGPLASFKIHPAAYFKQWLTHLTDRRMRMKPHLTSLDWVWQNKWTLQVLARTRGKRKWSTHYVVGVHCLKISKLLSGESCELLYMPIYTHGCEWYQHECYTGIQLLSDWV